MAATDRNRYKLAQEGRCRMCERPASVRPLTRHHLVPIRAGGTWRNQNIVPLCRPCHDLIEQPANLARLWRTMLRGRLTEGEVSHIRRVKGDNWLEHEYPSLHVIANAQSSYLVRLSSRERARVKRRWRRARNLSSLYSSD